MWNERNVEPTATSKTEWKEGGEEEVGEKSYDGVSVRERERKYIYASDWTKTISQPISVLLKTEYDTTAGQDRRRNKKN